jgi:hypothetical protein
MDDVNLTASMIVSFSKKLEDETAAFYQQLAGRFAEQGDAFAKAAEDAQKHKTWIVRTYQETISDALEACFCFQGMNLREYDVQTALAADEGLADALQRAVALEEVAISFYLEVAERSQSLLATIPAAFKRVAKKRTARRSQWEALI